MRKSINKSINKSTNQSINFKAIYWADRNNIISYDTTNQEKNADCVKRVGFNNRVLIILQCIRAQAMTIEYNCRQTCDGHEVVVICVGHIEFTSGKLWIVCKIDAFVSEKDKIAVPFTF